MENQYQKLDLHPWPLEAFSLPLVFSGLDGQQHQRYRVRDPSFTNLVCFESWLTSRHLGVSPVFAAAFIGAGFNVIFQQCINFLVDTYGLYAASAVSANTLLRSLLGAGFPLLAKPMFHNLGVGPAMSLLGAIATIAIPVPFIFMKYGLALRKKSKFAPVY